MNRMNMHIKRGLLFRVVLSLTILWTLGSVTESFAMYKHRKEIPMTVSLAEHFPFFSGKSYAFIIPYDGYYGFQLWGGNGGPGRNEWDSGFERYDIGGLGGYVAAIRYFYKGDKLTITVGEAGATLQGGFNGGGNGNAASNFFNRYYGGGGGGATDIRWGGDDLSNRVLVAGGGGGASGGTRTGSGSGYYPGEGGNGGTVDYAYLGKDGNGDGSGNGGTMTSGGVGYRNGSLGSGGNGNHSGGGGGGGYFGGGGSFGSAGGAGGGSSYVGSTFSQWSPHKIPQRADYVSDDDNGFAVISFLKG